MQEFTIASMSCGSCAGRITKAVKQLDDQARIEVDLPSRTIRVESTEDRASVAQALTEAGYPPA